MTRGLFYIGAALLLNACAVTSTVPAHSPIMPMAFSELTKPDLVMPAKNWWGAFNSQELLLLIASAISNNPDLASAAERVRQADAQVRIAGVSLLPSLNFGADTSRREIHVDGGNWKGSETSNATLSANYEVDLWGKNASVLRSAEASLRASYFDRETVRLTLISGVANAYFQVLSLRGRLKIARENSTISERVFNVVRSRVNNGAASTLDLTRQQAAVLTQKSTIPILELQERQTLFALAILLGREPEGFDVLTSAVTDLSVPRVAPGLPSQLLLRRPDLASAEAQLAAANANVAVARATMLPGIGLTSSAGLTSDALFSFLKAPTAMLTIGASLLQPIFDRGRLRAQTDAAAARERELIENYRKAILVALADVETALAAGSRTDIQEQLQERIVKQTRLTLKLAEIRYREGADDLLTVLDAQRILFQTEDQIAQVRLLRLQASVGLFKALGGTWNVPETADSL